MEREACPRCGSAQAGYEALAEAVVRIASEHRVEPVLQGLVHAARSLVGARHAALGIPDELGGFAAFITSGMTEAEVTAIGPLPRQHGMLDAALGSTESVLMPDLQRDPRFGGWPANHPEMRSYLGVPIVSKGDVIGAFYLTDKKGASEFDDADRRLIELFAAHAAVAIENARAFETSRELSTTEERNRLARELHDSVNQTLFSLVLTSESAAAMVGSDDAAARERLARVVELGRGAMTELRGLLFELRPPDVSSEGLLSTLRKHADVVRRVHGLEITVSGVNGRKLDPALEWELFRIAQEALNNAVKHARATYVDVTVEVTDKALCLRVRDDGVGFDPRVRSARSRHLGLTSMEERARSRGGSVRLESAPGEGTTVTVDVPT